MSAKTDAHARTARTARKIEYAVIVPLEWSRMALTAAKVLSLAAPWLCMCLYVQRFYTLILEE